MDESDLDREIDAIYDDLERGDAAAALARARDGLAREPGSDPVLCYLAGVALLELGRAADAAAELARAVLEDPEDPEFRARLALALYHAGRPEDAAPHAERALGAESPLPEAHEVRALLLEREGRFDDADGHLRRAGELDPEGYPPIRRFRPDDFARVVREAGDRLPAEFRRRLDEVEVVVEPIPPDELLASEGPPLDPGLLGLFVGPSIADRSYLGTGGELPPRILLFQRNLERFAAGADDLEEQIAITLYHELGHYLGLEEDELEELDLG